MATAPAGYPRVVAGPVGLPLQRLVEQVGLGPADGGEELGVAVALVAVDDHAAVVAAPDGHGVGGGASVADAPCAERPALVTGGLAHAAEEIGEPVEGDGVGHERALFCELDQWFVWRGGGGRPRPARPPRPP